MLFGDRTYVVYEDEHYTYAEIHAQVRALAHHLRDVHGVGAGDRVALAMRNYPEWVVGYWAITSLGAAVVGLNAWWTTPEMEYGLQDSRPKVLIADDERIERVLPVLDGLRAAQPAPADRRAHRSRPARRQRPLGGRRVRRRRAGRAARGRHRPRRRRHDLLHVGHDRLPEGRPAHPPRLGPQHLPPRVLGPRHRRRRGQGDRRRRGQRPGRSPPGARDRRLHGADAAVPRHGLQLPAAPVHADRRHDRVHLQVEPGSRRSS